jgi:formate dehydrogenase maturation protein FdhE
MKPHQLRRAIKRSPNKCPSCDSAAIESGPIIEFEQELGRHLGCNACDFSWYETFTLSDAITTD